MPQKKSDEFKRDASLSLAIDFEKISFLKRNGLNYLLQQGINQASKFQNFYVKDHLPKEYEFNKNLFCLKNEIEDKIKAMTNNQSVNICISCYFSKQNL